MSVYFIRNTRTKAVKVGFSRHPAERLQALQSLCEDRLEIAAALDDSPLPDHRAERIFHETLKKAGEHLHGEWFRGHMVDTFVLAFSDPRGLCLLWALVNMDAEPRREIAEFLRARIDRMDRTESTAFFEDLFRRHPLGPCDCPRCGGAP